MRAPWLVVVLLTLALAMGERTAIELRQATVRPRVHLEMLRGGGGAGPGSNCTTSVPEHNRGSKEKGPKKSKGQKLPRGWIYCNGFNTPIAGSKLLSIKAPLDRSFFNE